MAAGTARANSSETLNLPREGVSEGDQGDPGDQIGRRDPDRIRDVNVLTNIAQMHDSATFPNNKRGPRHGSRSRRHSSQSTNAGRSSGGQATASRPRSRSKPRSEY
ncbi:hypothetical protein DTO166G4_1733 [Paecilomyces variotii]|nr:hypothetical protein DTO032I3_4472 [Paecilomyces variotii]KAJ9202912.1 hypothetical protein DTO164E3_2885 [Paecilomyces variotii]KAJ9216517.1 hypothetical protein DTO166G4_1733 [Paecilomyces variotii]KAJ9223325.1 hypothetical protein DTO169C6_4371 [Paecilomyces variotii]KAJ9239489.1 hypothetical protein DTO166G5_2236 [Paecilomyces variotii]